MKQVHEPVLLSEVVSNLKPLPRQTIVDGTYGFGGHALALAKSVGAEGRVIGIEQDERTLKEAAKSASAWPQISLIHGNFSNIAELLASIKIEKVDAVLLDLGISSYQLQEKEYGLSWQENAPLDMRLSNNINITALDIIKNSTEKELADKLYNNADEYKSRRIARAIKDSINNIKTTKDLAETVEKTIGRHGKIHPATKTFQALRIEVNNEFENLRKFFIDVKKVLKKDGKVAVISFHSGEDRIVKHEFKKEGWEQITKKPIQASLAETKSNPRSRSAKLRVGKFIKS